VTICVEVVLITNVTKLAVQNDVRFALILINVNSKRPGVCIMHNGVDGLI